MADRSADGGQHARDATLDLRARNCSRFGATGLLPEISPDDLRAHCASIVDRGAPANGDTRTRYPEADLRVCNPPRREDCQPRGGRLALRRLRPSYRRIVHCRLPRSGSYSKLSRKSPTLPTIRLGMRFFLLSMVRKSELQDAIWDEVDFENAVWTIPKERMKRSKAHNVYLSRQMLDILIALKTCAGNSRYLLPSRYDADAPMSLGRPSIV